MCSCETLIVCKDGYVCKLTIAVCDLGGIGDLLGPSMLFPRVLVMV